MGYEGYGYFYSVFNEITSWSNLLVLKDFWVFTSTQAAFYLQWHIIKTHKVMCAGKSHVTFQTRRQTGSWCVQRDLQVCTVFVEVSVPADICQVWHNHVYSLFPFSACQCAAKQWQIRGCGEALWLEGEV